MEPTRSACCCCCCGYAQNAAAGVRLLALFGFSEKSWSGLACGPEVYSLRAILDVDPREESTDPKIGDYGNVEFYISLCGLDLF